MTGTGMLPEQQKAHELGEMDIEDEGRSISKAGLFPLHHSADPYSRSQL